MIGVFERGTDYRQGDDLLEIRNKLLEFVQQKEDAGSDPAGLAEDPELVTGFRYPVEGDDHHVVAVGEGDVAYAFEYPMGVRICEGVFTHKRAENA